METTKKIKGFTVIELLVVLALSSLSVSVSYKALNYAQSLFNSFKEQTRFIENLIRIKSTIDVSALKANTIIEINKNQFEFSLDSNKVQLVIYEEAIVLRKKNQKDSLNIKGNHLKVQYEEMESVNWHHKLVKELSFDFEFKKQKFLFCFAKQHDASTKLKLNQD